MKMRKALLLGVVVFAFGICPLQGQETGEGEGRESEQKAPKEKSVRRMEVKRYMGVSPEVANRAITRGLNRHVRFSDTYEGARSAPRSLRNVSLDGKRYRIAAMIRTGSNLFCLVPADQKDTINKLQQSNGIAVGQKITIEATTLGMAAPGGVLLLDRMITGEGEKSSIEHQLVLRWPQARGVEPIRINEPGEHSVSFPCRHERGDKAKIRLVIKQRDRKKFLAEIKKKKAKTTDESKDEEKKGDEEEEDEEDKEYRRFEASAVYRQIREGNRLDVEFEDKAKGTPPSVSRSIRLPEGRRIRLGAAFDTYTGITCLVPQKEEKMVELVNRLIPGQRVKIWGATLPPLDEYRPLIVDKIEIPGSTKPQQSDSIWDVTLFWSDIDSVRFYKIGSYNLTFPCQHEEDRQERLNIELREVRVISEE